MKDVNSSDIQMSSPVLRGVSGTDRFAVTPLFLPSWSTWLLGGICSSVLPPNHRGLEVTLQDLGLFRLYLHKLVQHSSLAVLLAISLYFKLPVRSAFS